METGSWEPWVGAVELGKGAPRGEAEVGGRRDSHREPEMASGGWLPGHPFCGLSHRLVPRLPHA